MGQHYLRGSDAHFKSWSQIVSMKDDGVESLNRKEAPIVSSETVGELTSSLQIFTNFGIFWKDSKQPLNPPPPHVMLTQIRTIPLVCN